MTEIVNCDNDCQMSAMIEIMLIQQFKHRVEEQRSSVDEAYLPSSLSSGLHYCYMHRHCCVWMLLLGIEYCAGCGVLTMLSVRLGWPPTQRESDEILGEM